MLFRSGDTYKSFTADELNSNMLAAIHTSPAQLAAQQQTLDAARQAYREAQQPQIPDDYQRAAIPVDDVFENEKKRMDEADATGDLSDTVDRITNGLNDTFSEIIENAILNGADGTQVAKLERERDLAKLKVLNYAVELAKISAERAKKAEQIAQTNMDEFNANPMAYLTNHPDAGKTNSAQ
jgi:hypothetical protein